MHKRFDIGYIMMEKQDNEQKMLDRQKVITSLRCYPCIQTNCRVLGVSNKYFFFKLVQFSFKDQI